MISSPISAINFLLLIVFTTAAEHRSQSDRTCRCVPNAWVGLLQTTNRQFDLIENNVMLDESTMRIMYDYRHKIVSMQDLQSETIVITDYRHNMRYFVTEAGCEGMSFPGAMEQMCIPDDATFRGEYEMATGLRLEMWQYTNPDNITIRTALSKATCMPISEESTIIQNEYAEVNTNLYLNVDLEHTSDAIIKVPSSCRHRSRHHLSLNAIREKRSAFHKIWKQEVLEP